jgi:hypothetical protein
MIHTGNLEIITEIPSELLELITQYAHSVDCTTPNKFWTNAHVGVRTRRFDNGVRHPLIDRLLALPKFNGCADRLINYEFICLDAGGDDVFIAKFNSSGDLIWNRVWGGDSSDYGNGVIQLSDGNYMMIGYNGSFGSDADSAFLAKYSDSGDLIWSKSWNGSSYDQAFDIINTSDNGFSITGTTRSFGAGNEDVFIAKYTSDGTLSWSRTWGKDGTEEGNSIIQTSDGDYVISGTTRILGAGSTGVNAFIAKFKSDGMLLWSKDWGGASQSDTSTNVSLAADGGYVIVGETRSYGAGGLDAFVAKFLSNGALLWSEVIGGSGSDFGRGRAVQTADGGFVLTGGLGSYGYSGYGDSLLLKIKSDGKISCSLITCQNVSAASADLTVSMNSAAATEESITVVLNNPSVTIVNRNPTKVKIAP